MRLSERLSKRHASSRGFHTAVVTTFAVDFCGFEEIILPQLATAGATNILLICDERMSALALNDGSILPRQLGRNYALFGPNQAAGVFHPKIVVQLGRDGGRAFVGSANATAAGVSGNLEIVTEIACTAEPGPERDFVRSAWAYVEEIAGAAKGAAADALDWARARTSWLAEPFDPAVGTLADGGLLGLLTRPGPAEIADRFVSLIGGERVERLIVMSPYWDDGLAALGDLAERLGSPAILVLVDPGAHGLPHPMPVIPNLTLVDCSSWRQGRFKHAKLILAQTKEHDHVLSGSANCTQPALGARSRPGVNAEASVYRRTARDVAVSALDLNGLVSGPTLAVATLSPAVRPAPIPLQAMQDRRPGRFEAEHGELRWRPPSRPWAGALALLDDDGVEVGRLDVAAMTGSGETRTARRDDLDKVRFIRIENGEEVSTVAPLSHRGFMRTLRREAATRAAVSAAAKFAGSSDLQLFLIEALDELMRADVEATSTPTPRLQSKRGTNASGAEVEAEPNTLSYADFVALKPHDRRASGGESSIAGMHIDPVRMLLNKLSGVRSDRAEEEGDGSWMDLGDEDTGPIPKATPSDPDAQPKLAFDRNAFMKAAETYQAHVAAVRRQAVADRSEVLRLRFWLMLLTHAGRSEGQPEGLPSTTDEHGWPRLALRILAAFFYGPSAPVTKLTVEPDRKDLPVDFLEAWATALWTIDLLPEATGSGSGRAEFLKHVPALRRCMVGRMGMTQEEMRGETIVSIRAGLDRDFGQRLRDANKAEAPLRLKQRSTLSLKAAGGESTEKVYSRVLLTSQ